MDAAKKLHRHMRKSEARATIRDILEKKESQVTLREMQICLANLLMARARSKATLKATGYLESVAEEMLDLGFQRMAMLRAEVKKREEEDGNE